MLSKAGFLGYPLGQTAKGFAMSRRMILVLCAGLTVTGCARLAESRLNPLTWFGPSTTVATAPAAGAERRPLVPAGRASVTVDARVPVDRITALAVDRRPGGGILRATGLAAGPGPFNAQLVRRGVEGGVLVLDFVVERPAGVAVSGTQRVTVATLLDAAELDSVRVIRVRAAEGAREVRR